MSASKDVESGEPEIATVKQRAIDRNLRIVGAVAFYFVVSMALVLLNKRALATVGRDFPLFVTWWQFVVALAMIAVGGEVGKVYPTLRFFAPLEFKRDKAIAVLPVTIIFIAMVAMSNLCLKFVEVSFYQVARSLTLFFSVTFTYLILHQSTSPRALACCGVLVFGFVIGSWGEVNFSLLGSVFGVASSALGALYGIYVKKVLGALNNDSDVLLVYNTLLSIVLLLPIIVVSEGAVLAESPVLRTYSAWSELTLAGVFGLLINIATYLQIRLTSALTHNISGTAKAAAQTVLGIIIYQNPVTAMGLLGVICVILGAFAYTYVRKQEMDLKDAVKASDTSK